MSGLNNIIKEIQASAKEEADAILKEADDFCNAQMEEAKIEIATMTEEDAPVLQLLHEIDSRKGIKAAVETRLADLSTDTDINQESEAVEETEAPAEQPEGGEENDV